MNNIHVELGTNLTIIVNNIYIFFSLFSFLDLNIVKTLGGLGTVNSLQNQSNFLEIPCL